MQGVRDFWLSSSASVNELGYIFSGSLGIVNLQNLTSREKWKIIIVGWLGSSAAVVIIIGIRPSSSFNPENV